MQGDRQPLLFSSFLHPFQMAERSHRLLSQQFGGVSGAAGAHTEQEEEEVEDGRQGRKCIREQSESRQSGYCHKTNKHAITLSVYTHNNPKWPTKLWENNVMFSYSQEKGLFA